MAQPDPRSPATSEASSIPTAVTAPHNGTRTTPRDSYNVSHERVGLGRADFGSTQSVPDLSLGVVAPTEKATIRKPNARMIGVGKSHHPRYDGIHRIRAGID